MSFQFNLMHTVIMIFFTRHINQKRTQMQKQQISPVRKKYGDDPIIDCKSNQLDSIDSFQQKAQNQTVQGHQNQTNYFFRLLFNKKPINKIQMSQPQEKYKMTREQDDSKQFQLNRDTQSKIETDKSHLTQEHEGQQQVQINNLISQILDQPLHLQSPQFVKVKNNILIILLLLSSYGVYYVIGQFLDVILVAFIAGISYQQARNNFVNIYLESSPAISANKINFKKRLAYGVVSSVAILSLPWIRKFLSDPEQIMRLQSYWQIISYGFVKKESKMIYHLQLLGGLFVMSFLAGSHNIVYFLKKIKLAEKYATQIIEILFALGTILIIVFFLVTTPLVLYREVIATGSQIQAHIESHFNCSLIDVGTVNGVNLPHCHQMITGSEFLKQTITQLKYQNQSINECVSMINTFESEYLGRNSSIGEYSEELCTWVRLGQKANEYFNENTKNMVLSTSTSILKTVFGNLTSFIQLLSMCLFNLTTFSTVFYLTVKHFDPKKNLFSDIFSGQRGKLFNQITTLIQATFFISIQHFFMSFLLLEIFNFSSFNMILSLVLSLMAFIPLFRPWFGMLILASMSVLFNNLQILLSIEQFVTTLDLYSAILLVSVYYYISETIYSINLLKMEVHQIIINLTVLFGIYKFGVLGIFYGPLIVIMFRCIHRQLLKNSSLKSSSNIRS